jgi:iron complex outermembrane recepter protein
VPCFLFKVIMSKKSYKTFYLSIIAMAAHAAVQAQTAEIVVSNNPFQAKEISAPVERLNAEVLLLRPSSSLGEALSGLAGVSSTYFGGTASRPIIRGLDGDRIRILSNGAASTDVSGLSFDHAVADNLLAAESIEIVRGPAALVYGGAAVGGVVNLLNNRIAKTAQFGPKGGQLGKVQLGYGSGSNEAQGAALLETGTDKYALHVDVFTRKAGEVRVPTAIECTQNGVARTERKICNSQSDATGGALGGSLLFDHGYLGASVENTKQNYGSPAEADVKLKMQTNRFKLEGEQRQLGALGGWVQAISGYLVRHQYQHQEFEGAELGTTFKSQGQEAKLQARFKNVQTGAGLLSTAFGTVNERVDFVANGSEAFVPSTRSSTRSMYALQELNADWGKLSAGIRRDQAQIDSLGLEGNATFAATQRSLSANSYALGSVFQLGALATGLSLTADWARTGRIPKDYELYADGEHVATKAYERGNADLGVERSTHTELGLRWVGARPTDRVKVNLFSTRYDNYIYLQNTGDTSAEGNPVLAFTATPAKFSGWELSGAKRLLAATSAQASSVDLEARYSQVSAIQSLTGESLPRIPPVRMGVDLVGKVQSWGWRVGADYRSAQNNIPSGQQATGGSTLWHAALTHQQKSSLGRMLWFARLDNATNQLAYSATSILTQTAPGRVPLPGRSLRVGLQLSF